jgi:hypothetical protein
MFTAPTCTAIIIPLKRRALNAEIEHVLLRFNKISFAKTTKRGWNEALRQGEDRVTLGRTLLHS